MDAGQSPAPFQIYSSAGRQRSETGDTGKAGGRLVKTLEYSAGSVVQKYDWNSRVAMNGLEVMRTIREESPSTDVLVLTMHFSEELVQEVLRCGALGFVLKADADTEFLAALDNVRHHQPFLATG
jgi:DNA-binding NarL/FixJ family response regulator